VARKKIYEQWSGRSIPGDADAEDRTKSFPLAVKRTSRPPDHAASKLQQRFVDTPP
jgi:hypothetical protein